MIKRPITTLIVFLSLVLPACSPIGSRISLTSVVNVARIETTLKEDGSGFNTFWLVVPSGVDCPLVNLKPALEQLSNPTSPTVTNYRDEEFRGFLVTYGFQNYWEIPAQIENIKDTVVDAVIAATPTPIEVPETPQPTPESVGDYYDPRQLSIVVESPTTQLTGERWDIHVTVNPFLMTGLIAENIMVKRLDESCSLSKFTYVLTVSNKMKIREYEVKISPELIPFSTIEQIAPNSIEWTIESKQAYEILVREFKTLMSRTPPPSEEELSAGFERVLGGPSYTLSVTATTPSPWFSLLTNVIAPIIGLAAVALGLFVTLKNLFGRRKQREK